MNSDTIEPTGTSNECSDVAVYTAALKQAQAAVTAAREACNTAFVAGARALFATHPNLYSFGWKQYTPDDWDGKFSVDVGFPDINGFDGVVVDADPDKLEPMSPAVAQKLKVAATLQPHVTEMLSTFDEHLMAFLFGDQSAVLVFRDGSVDVRDYADDD